ncbi:MAG: helix-turn-helix domain-containing protein [bacterium]
MQYAEWEPSPRLAPFVRRIWTLRGPATGAFAPEPIVPDGCVELIFHLGDPFAQVIGDRRTVQSRAIVVGQATAPAVVGPTGVVDVVGVRLHPWSAAPLLGVSAAELRDRVLSMDDVLGSTADRLWNCLVDRSAHRSAPKSIERIVEEVFALRDRPDPNAIALVRHFTSQPDVPSIRATANHFGRTSRWVQRTFAESVGLAPKMLIRIVRIQRVLRMARENPAATWSSMAMKAGYYDQAHLIRDFRQLVGAPPTWLDLNRGSLTETFLSS